MLNLNAFQIPQLLQQLQTAPMRPDQFYAMNRIGSSNIPGLSGNTPMAVLLPWMNMRMSPPNTLFNLNLNVTQFSGFHANHSPMPNQMTMPLTNSQQPKAYNDSNQVPSPKITVTEDPVTSLNQSSAHSGSIITELDDKSDGDEEDSEYEDRPRKRQRKTRSTASTSRKSRRYDMKAEMDKTRRVQISGSYVQLQRAIGQISLAKQRSNNVPVCRVELLRAAIEVIDPTYLQKDPQLLNAIDAFKADANDRAEKEKARRAALSSLFAALRRVLNCDRVRNRDRIVQLATEIILKLKLQMK